MGIQNLLRFMKPFIEPIHINKYSGKRVGIDASSWLHKGAYSCSMELCLNLQGDAGKRYLKYFMHHINLLRHYKITPVVVFDGGNIPCKSTTEHERYRRRESNLALAKEKLNQGNVGAAIEFFQKAVQVTPSMAHELIQILRAETVEFVVAPYEADAQLGYLSTLDTSRGGIAAVITEDSDLIAYGCQAIIFKMDRFGKGEEFVMDRVFNTVPNGLSFRQFDKELLIGMCVLAGCDFLPSIPGIGTKRAHSLVSKYKNLDRVLSALKFDKRYKMAEDYSQCFRKAVAVFHHALIYDAKTKALKPMQPMEQKHLESLNGDLDILGPELPPSIAAAIAEGHLNPITMEAFDHFTTAGAFIDTVAIPTFDQLDRDKWQTLSADETETISTQESCISVFSAYHTNNQSTTGVEKINLDQKKYMKEAAALGKLVSPMKCCALVVEHQVHGRETFNNNPFKKMKLEDDKREVPNDNPFKKMKLENSGGRNCSTLKQISVLTNVETSVGIMYSSPESQDTVESKPVKKSLVTEGKAKKLNTKNCSKVRNNKSGILKFFERL